MKTLVLGAKGQVGSALLGLLGGEGVAADYPQVDLAAPESLGSWLDRLADRETLGQVINAAAYTAVDQAEKEEDLADRINAQAPGVVARWCASRNLPFVHYSTDYVFAGDGVKPWKESDATGPLSAYGRTKLSGERVVTAAGGRHLVFRTSWVYDAYGKNFVRTMLRLGAERAELRVVSDQHGAPTYAPHLAQATLGALAHARALSQFPSGIYHLCGGGETTWHEFAVEIFSGARALGWNLRVGAVAPIPAAMYPTPARRPMNSRLDADKASRILGVGLPHWRKGLAECLPLISKETA